MSDQNGTIKIPKGRSPSYPGISLPKAIDRARTVYEAARHHSLPLGTITSKWGYNSPTSGPASVTYAALKKFGLLEEEGHGGERVGHLTNLALDVLMPNPNRDEAIRRAALMPAIHRDWYDRYGIDLPPDDTLHFELVVRGSWTETGLKEYLREYKETMSFAKLGTAVKDGREDSRDKGDDRETTEGNREGPLSEVEQGREDVRPTDRFRRPRVAGMKTYAIPVDPDHDAVVELPTPMTPTRWANFQKFLSAMESVIVDHNLGAVTGRDDDSRDDDPTPY